VEFVPALASLERLRGEVTREIEQLRSQLPEPRFDPLPEPETSEEFDPWQRRHKLWDP
jgi:hypothetical protein